MVRSDSAVGAVYRFCERNHQGLGNELLSGEPPPTIARANVKRHKRIGGLLNHYHREAA